mmetsp:Transcript_30720/g.76720  ORF Transcript_30720/g.76720 Transcript_30720/m.76720 type:complete len:104 (+) Transcript_30720:136-447(+)
MSYSKTSNVAIELSAQPVILQPAARRSCSKETASAVISSPGIKIGIPGGYGQTRAAEICPIAFAAGTLREPRKNASRGLQYDLLHESDREAATAAAFSALALV